MWEAGRRFQRFGAAGTVGFGRMTEVTTDEPIAISE